MGLEYDVSYDVNPIFLHLIMISFLRYVGVFKTTIMMSESKSIHTQNPSYICISNRSSHNAAILNFWNQSRMPKWQTSWTFLSTDPKLSKSLKIFTIYQKQSSSHELSDFFKVCTKLRLTTRDHSLIIHSVFYADLASVPSTLNSTHTRGDKFITKHN